jgi:ArsR family transcriptional regulator
MPTLESELIRAPAETKIRFSVEPAVNALGSLLFLSQTDRYSGLDPWITNATDTLSQSVLFKNQVVMQGLFYAWIPDRSWASFPTFIEHIEKTDAQILRNRIVDTYLNLPCKNESDVEIEPPSPEELLADYDSFIHYLNAKFAEGYIDEKVESAAFKLLVKPDEMRAYITDHFRSMWEEMLIHEWARVLPMIEESVIAFDRYDFSSMTDLEAAQFITGQSGERWKWIIEKSESVVFVPTKHSGPYSYGFKSGSTGWILFSAHLPEGTYSSTSELSRSELLVRLNALADDTRLSIISSIRTGGEVCAQDLIERLHVSQSSISRHLRQLTASGFIHERRTEAGKCYTLNPARMKDTVEAIETLYGEE